jgi:hypothetical protein
MALPPQLANTVCQPRARGHGQRGEMRHEGRPDGKPVTRAPGDRRPLGSSICNGRRCAAQGAVPHMRGPDARYGPPPRGTQRAVSATSHVEQLTLAEQHDAVVPKGLRAPRASDVAGNHRHQLRPPAPSISCGRSRRTAVCAAGGSTHLAQNGQRGLPGKFGTMAAAPRRPSYHASPPRPPSTERRAIRHPAPPSAPEMRSARRLPHGRGCLDAASAHPCPGSSHRSRWLLVWCPA